MVPRIALGCSWAPWDWRDCVSEHLGNAINSVTGGLFSFIFDAIRQVVIAAVEAVLKAVGTVWIDIDTPDVANAAGQATGVSAFIQVHTHWILVTAAGISVILAGIRMALEARGEPLRDILKSLLTLVVVSGCGVAFAGLLIDIADAFSEDIIDQAIQGSTFAARITDIVLDPVASEGVGLALVIVIGICVVITSLVQLAMMVVRYGMLVLLVGLLPLTAAATNTDAGMAWFKRAVGWLAAFIIYKPIAALIYAGSIMLIGAPDGADATLKVVTGVTMMVMAVVALPALLRFVSPKAG
jgi:TrbL/VirB6 plasmid conjugal transfer protein